MNEMEKKNLTLMTKVRKITESRYFVQILPVVFLLALFAFFTVATDGRIAQLRTVKMLAEQALIVGTVATGAAFIYSTNNVNISMGATTVMTATLAVMVYNATGSVTMMIVFSVLFGVAVMLLSAILSTLLHIKVMFVTIVAMVLFKAIQDVLLNGQSLSVPYEVYSGLSNKGFLYFGFAAFLIFSVVIFNFTRVGRGMKMIGTNRTCAGMTGIEYSPYLTLAFAIAGIGCGIGAIMVIIRSGTIGSTTMTSLNMDVLLAMVLGGMSIFGGSKSFVYSGIIGSLTVCLLNQGLIMINVDVTIIQGIRGLLFLILVATAQQRPKILPAPEG